MQNILLVGFGGFLGSVARYSLGGLIAHMTAQDRLPLGILTINILGCLVVGVLAGVTERYGMFGLETRLFLFTGLLGGFTTFSAFGLEAMHLIRRGDLGTAALYAGGSVLFGITAVWLGLKLVSMVSR